MKLLASTIKQNDVVLCFDRFFTSVHLLETLNFPALGTCISNRKNMPAMKDKAKKLNSMVRFRYTYQSRGPQDKDVQDTSFKFFT